MIVIEQGESTPYIKIDPENYSFIIKGNSFVTNPHQFYSAVNEWGKSLNIEDARTLNIEITMGYYSTSNIQFLNLFFKTLINNNKDKVELSFFLEEEEEEDLEETMLSLIFNTGIPLNKHYL